MRTVTLSNQQFILPANFAGKASPTQADTKGSVSDMYICICRRFTFYLAFEFNYCYNTYVVFDQLHS